MGWEGPLTHRQYEVWQEWLVMEWNRPTRTDHYLMELAMVMRQGQVKRPRSIKLDHFRLDFERRSGPEPGQAAPQSVEEAAAISKATWAARLGLKPSEVKGEPKKDAEPIPDVIVEPGMWD